MFHFSSFEKMFSLIHFEKNQATSAVSFCLFIIFCLFIDVWLSYLKSVESLVTDGKVKKLFTWVIVLKSNDLCWSFSIVLRVAVVYLPKVFNKLFKWYSEYSLLSYLNGFGDLVILFILLGHIPVLLISQGPFSNPAYIVFLTPGIPQLYYPFFF